MQHVELYTETELDRIAEICKEEARHYWQQRQNGGIPNGEYSPFPRGFLCKSGRRRVIATSILPEQEWPGRGVGNPFGAGIRTHEQALAFTSKTRSELRRLLEELDAGLSEGRIMFERAALPIFGPEQIEEIRRLLLDDWFWSSKEGYSEVIYYALDLIDAEHHFFRSSKAYEVMFKNAERVGTEIFHFPEHPERGRLLLQQLDDN